MIIFIIAGSLVAAVFAAVIALGAVLPSVGDVRRDEADRYILVRGSKIRYRAMDSAGPPVVMLHGFGGNLSEWEPLMEKLRGVRALALDLIGFGLSDKPPICYDLETQREYLLSFMDAMGIPKAVLVGSSMGSSVALWAAAKSPERVAGVIAFAPSAYPGSMRHAWPGDIFYRPGPFNRIVRTISGTALYGAFFPQSLGRQAMDVTASYNSAFTESLPGVRQPVLLIWSRGDTRVPFVYSDRYRELLPNAVFIEARPESGHDAAGDPTPEILDGIRDIIIRKAP
jgi:pimeloyl-ACP methyl ester carboxylesterase